MAEYGVATISVLMPHSRLRPRAADLPRSWNTTQPSPISATHIGKRLAGKLHEPFERAGGGRAKTPPLPTLQRDSVVGRRGSRTLYARVVRCRPHRPGLRSSPPAAREVLDRLRNRLALRYLEDERVSLQQTAWLLGYSEIGAFNHAFKRWTGTSPGRARN